MRRRVVVVLACLAAAGCDQKKAAPRADAAPSAAPSVSASASVAIPLFVAVSRITLKQEQPANPALRACDGVVTEVVIDLAREEWTNTLCTPRDAGQDPRTTDHGRLGETARKRIEQAWDKLVRVAPAECDPSAGFLTMTVIAGDGAIQTWADPHACRKGGPLTANGIGELGNEIRLALAKK